MPGKKTSTSVSKPVNIDKSDARNTGLRAHFHCLKPPQQSFQDVIQGRCAEEKAVDIISEEEDADMEIKEDLSDVHRIQQRVFTGKKPEFIKMTGKDNLIDRAKRLNIYEKGMKREEIETALMKYWIDQLAGDKDLYFSSLVFQQAKQDIDRGHKEDPNIKRKRAFVEAAESKDENAPKKRKHKSALSAKVRWACSPNLPFWNCINFCFHLGVGRKY